MVLFQLIISKRDFSWFSREVKPTQILYFLDGTDTLYECKNWKSANLAYHEEDCEVLVEWHFFSTSHTKGPCYGIGGTMNRLVTKPTKNTKLSNSDHLPAVWVGQENIAEILTKFVSKDDIGEHQTFSRATLNKSITMAGTQTLHAFKTVQGKHRLLVKR